MSTDHAAPRGIGPWGIGPRDVRAGDVRADDAGTRDAGADEAPSADPYGGRFPGFDVMDQRRHWDRVTAAAIGRRLESPTTAGAFTDREQRTTVLLIGHLLDLDERTALMLAAQIGNRLEAGETDGWHYDDMPEDVVAWRRSLHGLDDEARLRAGVAFAELDPNSRHRILAGVNGAGSADWHGLAGAKVWNMWMRYVCTAFYAQPSAWNEIGFPGPAYPRGYKNPGVDRREPFEVADSGPVIHLARRAPRDAP